MSTDISQLPFLLHLIDDDSPRVQQRVQNALRAFPDLGQQVHLLQRAGEIHLSPVQQSALDSFLAEEARNAARKRISSWLDWRDEPNANRRLEIALGALSQWQHSVENEYSNHNVLVRIPGSGEFFGAQNTLLSQSLDKLSDAFRATGQSSSPDALSAWLFDELGLTGNTFDYYDPRNSNLLDVIEWKRGNPISLTCVFVLVGQRLGLDIRGCNFPGHFLGHARWRSEDLLFDCFDGGRLLSAQETDVIRKAEPHLLQAPASPEAIVARVLRNLSIAYDHNDEFSKARFVRELLQSLETTT